LKGFGSHVASSTGVPSAPAFNVVARSQVRRQARGLRRVGRSSTRPVLEHGPRCLTCVRVVGSAAAAKPEHGAIKVKVSFGGGWVRCPALRRRGLRSFLFPSLRTQAGSFGCGSHENCHSLRRLAFARPRPAEHVEHGFRRTFLTSRALRLFPSVTPIFLLRGDLWRRVWRMARSEVKTRHKRVRFPNGSGAHRRPVSIALGAFRIS